MTGNMHQRFGVAGRAVALTVLLVASLPIFEGRADAVVTTYTSQSSFLGAITTPKLTLDFESQSVGAAVPSGTTLSGFTIAYSISDGTQNGHLNMKVANDYFTTSGDNYLTLNDSSNSNLFLSGDGFTLTFPATHAVGFYFITADTPAAGSFVLQTGSGSASNSVTPDTNPHSGVGAYFVGLVDTTNTFGTATITSSAGTGSPYFFYVDDISRGVPEPSCSALAVGAIGVLVRRRPRRSSRRLAGVGL